MRGRGSIVRVAAIAVLVAALGGAGYSLWSRHSAAIARPVTTRLAHQRRRLPASARPRVVRPPHLASGASHAGSASPRPWRHGAGRTEGALKARGSAHATGREVADLRPEPSLRPATTRATRHAPVSRAAPHPDTIAPASHHNALTPSPHTGTTVPSPHTGTTVPSPVASLAASAARQAPTSTTSAPATPSATPAISATPTPMPATPPSPTATATVAAAVIEAQVVQQITQAPLSPGYTTYVVRAGDTVVSIARRFHDVAWLIRRRNGGLWTLTPGQHILVWQWPFGVPYYAVREVVTDKPQYYRIVSGDSLGAIAARLHTDDATLATENGLGDGSLIYAGQTLVLHHYTSRQQRVFVPGVAASRLSMGLLLTDVSNLVGIDAALVKAVAWHESGWRMVRGHSGEIGAMQLMPYMAQWVQRNLIGYALDPNVRENNVLEGALLLRYYLDVTGVNTHKTLALYHSGDVRADQRNGLYLRAVLWMRDWYYHHPHAGL